MCCFFMLFFSLPQFEMDFNSMFNIPNNSLHLFTEWPKLAAFIQSKVPKDVLKGIQTSKTNGRT